MIARRPGLLERAVTRLLMRPAQVSSVVALSENFRLIRFQHDALKACSWSPGDKIQVKLDDGLATRTYTPISWDNTEGVTEILAYTHGEGPGTQWARTVAPGGVRQILGPRGSLDLDGFSSSVILFGDETSFGLAAALRRSTPGHNLHFVFEVSDPTECCSIADQFGLAPLTMIARSPSDTHLGELAETVHCLRNANTRYVLSGKAPSIQYVSRALKAHGITSRDIRAKAYWSPGKIGLD